MQKGEHFCYKKNADVDGVSKRQHPVYYFCQKNNTSRCRHHAVRSPIVEKIIHFFFFGGESSVMTCSDACRTTPVVIRVARAGTVVLPQLTYTPEASCICHVRLFHRCR